MKTVGIIGAGVMGNDVAMTLAYFNYNVRLLDINKEILDLSKQKIHNNFRSLKMVRPEIKSSSIKDIMGRIAFIKDYNNLSDVDIIIENVTENWKVKKEVYKKLNTICKKEVFYFVNTSCISITKIGALMKYPDKVIGMHFMNPVFIKKGVEVIKGFHTSKETVEFASLFLNKINKKPIMVNDFPGFVANRLSHLFMNEAAFLIQDQVAAAKDIDQIFKMGYGHAMGPLETADLIGLDTVVDSLGVLYENYQDPKFKCSPLLQKMVNAGLLGRKSGQGFYKY